MRIDKMAVLVLLAMFSAPVLAAGNLTVYGSGTLVSHVNTNSSNAVLNLSLNVTPSAGDGTVNITAINVTVSPIGFNAGNITAVEIKNATGLSLGSNTTNATGTGKFVISIPSGYFLSNTSNTTFLVFVNISRTATRNINFSLNITASDEIGTQGSNVTIATTSINSTAVFVQNLHANASVSPVFVDTSVINQSFVYTLVSTGADPVQNITVSVPSGYTSINLTAVQQGSSNLSTSLYSNTTVSNQINITLNTPVSDTFKVFFTANTSSSPVSSSAFASTITGSNLTGVSTDVVANQTNVTTKVLANVTDTLVSKTVAVVNGTDYWEFNFTVNLTETISGLLQFKMTNWNNTAGSVIDIVGGGTNLTTLRKDTDFNTTNKFNVKNDYNITDGLSYSGASGLVTIYLRQIIPSGTPISATWFTTYSILFRSAA
jgi:hypothetical protein